MVPDRTARVALTIAGSDPSGGAGVQMDLKCFAAVGVHGCSALTAVTVQNTTGVRSANPLSPKLVREQLEALYDDFKIDIVKTGMLYEAAIVEVVTAKLGEEGTPLVVDPVLAATAGAPLASNDLAGALKQRLLPKALLVTPNIAEAEEMTGVHIRGEDSMRHACIELYQLGCENVLLKGGHIPKGPANDLLYDGTFHVLEGPRLERNVHGTGCMLSAFSAGMLAKGLSVPEAVGLAKLYVMDAIRFSEGHGKGRLIGNPFVNIQKAAQKFEVLEAVQRWSGTLEETLPVSLIPETGVNIAFALPFATGLGDICALEGRLVRAGKRARRSGYPAFGASRNVGSVVLAAMKADRRFRSALNLRYSKALVELCRTLGLKIGSFDRKRVHADADSSVSWGAGAVVSALGFVPDVISDEGGHGTEPMLFLLGEHPQQLVEKVGMMVKGLKER